MLTGRVYNPKEEQGKHKHYCQVKVYGRVTEMRRCEIYLKKEILLIFVIPGKFGGTKLHSQHLQNEHVGAIFQQETAFLHRLEKLN